MRIAYIKTYICIGFYLVFKCSTLSFQLQRQWPGQTNNIDNKDPMRNLKVTFTTKFKRFNTFYVIALTTLNQVRMNHNFTYIKWKINKYSRE